LLPLASRIRGRAHSREEVTRTLELWCVPQLGVLRRVLFGRCPSRSRGSDTQPSPAPPPLRPLSPPRSSTRSSTRSPPPRLGEGPGERANRSEPREIHRRPHQGRRPRSNPEGNPSYPLRLSPLASRLSPHPPRPQP
jgi:hypothetical protein